MQRNVMCILVGARHAIREGVGKIRRLVEAELSGIACAGAF